MILPCVAEQGTAVTGKIHSHHSSAHSPAYSPPTTLPQPPSPSRWQRLRSLHARTPREHKAPRAPTSPCRFHRSKFNAAPRRRRGTATSRAREPSIPSIPTPKFLHRRSRGTRIARHSPPVPLRPRLISSRRRPRSEGGGGSGPMTCARAEDAVSPAADCVAAAPV